MISPLLPVLQTKYFICFFRISVLSLALSTNKTFFWTAIGSAASVRNNRTKISLLKYLISSSENKLPLSQIALILLSLRTPHVKVISHEIQDNNWFCCFYHSVQFILILFDARLWRPKTKVFLVRCLVSSSKTAIAFDAFITIYEWSSLSTWFIARIWRTRTCITNLCRIIFMGFLQQHRHLKILPYFQELLRRHPVDSRCRKETLRTPKQSCKSKLEKTKHLLQEYKIYDRQQEELTKMKRWVHAFTKRVCNEHERK